MEEYYSHYREQDDKFQANREHQKNVAVLSRQYCQIEALKKTAYLIGLHHDEGKIQALWQQHFLSKIRGKDTSGRETVDHSTLGGLIVNEYEPGSMLSEMVQIAIFTHHGLADCVSVQDGVPLLAKRARKYDREEILRMKDICEQEMPEENMKKLCQEAREDLNKVLRQIKELTDSEKRKEQYGNKNFYLGMCERLLFSVLADADVRDTVDFTENKITDKGFSNQDMQQVWIQAKKSLEKRLEELQSQGQASVLGAVRQKISQQCEQAAYRKCSRYRLAVPTGAGKSLSALRFAICRAIEGHKRHIFYIAPFRSILEQNAEEIRAAVGNPAWVLEHHGDVVTEDEQENYRYERLIENWDEVPIIATTAVQFFNTAFKEKKRNLRRFHSLCGSIIIFDEVQALPDKVQGLFSLLVNFLTEICESVVVLCTATQLPLEARKENCMLKAEDMTESLSVYESSFRRVEYQDCTENGKKVFHIEDAVEMLKEKAESEKQVLAIFNTKEAAKKVYEGLKGQTVGKLFHLSTSMCAEHREEVLKSITAALKRGERVICISTQLVEAGVNFSFRCVIRSLAGLDNLIQAAGRCNRHGGKPLGQVYLIEMDKDAEDLTYLPEIRRAQEAMRKILRIYSMEPEKLENRLDSEKAIQAYYVERFLYRDTETRYPVTVEGVSVDLIDLLSANREFTGRLKGLKLRQAFRTAGEAFSLIEDKGGADVVVPYGESMELVRRLSETEEREERKYLMRKLQRYVVNLPESILKKMGPDAVSGQEDHILVLDKRYYSDDTGVRREPQEMELLAF